MPRVRRNFIPIRVGVDDTTNELKAAYSCLLQNNDRSTNDNDFFFMTLILDILLCERSNAQVGGHAGAQTEKVLSRSSNDQGGRHSRTERSVPGDGGVRGVWRHVGPNAKGMISGGFSLEVFKQWAPSEMNLIALPGREAIHESQMIPETRSKRSPGRLALLVEESPSSSACGAGPNQWRGRSRRRHQHGGHGGSEGPSSNGGGQSRGDSVDGTGASDLAITASQRSRAAVLDNMGNGGVQQATPHPRTRVCLALSQLFDPDPVAPALGGLGLLGHLSIGTSWIGRRQVEMLNLLKMLLFLYLHTTLYSQTTLYLQKHLLDVMMNSWGVSQVRYPQHILGRRQPKPNVNHRHYITESDGCLCRPATTRQPVRDHTRSFSDTRNRDLNTDLGTFTPTLNAVVKLTTWSVRVCVTCGGKLSEIASRQGLSVICS
ncbi:hypothetical protein Scep_015529 [Stephania cephalantha]|uniref:Uncharacterized protein n=1 Tax=Stephania cephalantha TaxID=152367 RepID=A0AAP0P1F4_9MAGN